MEQVRKSYASTEVVHGIDVEIADTQFCVLVGPSGCGKSTLLRMIAGLEEITSGRIRIGERVVNDVQARDRDIAMVFQNYALYPHMRVRENMAFSLVLARRPKAEIERRVAEAAAILGLTPYLDRYPRQLSGGQRQRVAMGRAIVRKPQVFLFDEPLSNLDAKLRVQMRGEIRELHQRLQTTSIYVTHDQIEAMTMADRIVVMHEGIVEQAGTPLEIYDRPANVFVATFIGSPSMNLLAGRIGEDAGSVELVGGARLALAQGVAAPPGTEVHVGVRPEHLELNGQGLACEIAVVEPTGADTQVIARCAAGELVASFRERHQFRPGDRIALAASPLALHVFDAASGARLPDQGFFAPRT
ncbi:MAG: sn-glycerol-3-phosphate ABC transporter ATP-binding protein UgpC [Burkholderiaceae bacterium]|nr:sn-glycerol-3-phosphate ABC transporter ATP-binding protein UgpC [Burkholderiaceae bacterium]